MHSGAPGDTGGIGNRWGRPPYEPGAAPTPAGAGSTEERGGRPHGVREQPRGARGARLKRPPRTVGGCSRGPDTGAARHGGSPRPRGCSPVVRSGPAHRLVLPAPAGLFPRRRRRRTSRRCAPRARRAVPRSTRRTAWSARPPPISGDNKACTPTPALEPGHRLTSRTGQQWDSGGYGRESETGGGGPRMNREPPPPARLLLPRRLWDLNPR